MADGHPRAMVTALDAPRRKAFDEFEERTRELFRADSADETVKRCLREQAFKDRYLLRFLQRDGFDVEKALPRFRETMEWRVSIGLDKGRFDADALRTQPGCSPVYLLSPFRTKTGDVVTFDWVEMFDGRTVSLDVHFKYFVAVMEDGVHMLEDNQTMFAILNYSGATWGSMTATHIWTPVLEAFRKHYPETLCRAVLLNTGMLFKLTFNLAKPFIARKTLEKFKVYGGEWKEKLAKHIDVSLLPAEWNMGGTFKSKYIDVLSARASAGSQQDDNVPPEAQLAQLKLAGDQLSSSDVLADDN